MYNRNETRLAIDSVTLSGSAIASTAATKPRAPASALARDSAGSYDFTVHGTALTAPWWLTPIRTGDLFASPVSTQTAESSAFGTAFASVYLAGGAVLRAPLVLSHRESRAR